MTVKYDLFYYDGWSLWCFPLLQLGAHEGSQGVESMSVVEVYNLSNIFKSLKILINSMDNGLTHMHLHFKHCTALSLSILCKA